jgi:hypothetical protein
MVLRFVGVWVEWADFSWGWAPRFVRRWEARQYNRTGGWGRLCKEGSATYTESLASSDASDIQQPAAREEERDG